MWQNIQNFKNVCCNWYSLYWFFSFLFVVSKLTLNNSFCRYFFNLMCTIFFSHSNNFFVLYIFLPWNVYSVIKVPISVAHLPFFTQKQIFSLTFIKIFISIKFWNSPDNFIKPRSMIPIKNWTWKFGKLLYLCLKRLDSCSNYTKFIGYNWCR